MITAGTAKFTNKDAYLAWYDGLTIEDADRFAKLVREASGEGHGYTPIPECIRTFYSLLWCHTTPYSDSNRLEWNKLHKAAATSLREFLSVAELYNKPIHVGRWHPGVFAFLYLSNPSSGILVPEPERYLEHIPDRDYSNISPAQLRAELMMAPTQAQMEIIPAEANGLTVGAMTEQKDECAQKIAQMSKDIDDVRKAKTAGLAEMKAEIERLQAELEAKKEAMLQELKAKMAEMEAAMEKMETQIFLLDSQIYAIRCFAGEVVKFAQLRSGRNAPNDTPVVVHQKLHFLDEDLGRLASLYDIQWEELGLFEEFLKHSPVAFDTFTPNDRCISLVRLSKDGTTIREHDKFPFQNLMKKYAYYHGGTVGILIRNGENLYIGWTDDERVYIEDDLILAKPTVEIVPETGYVTQFDRDRQVLAEKTYKKKVMNGIISRNFVYNIVQGIVEHTPILPLPAGVTLGQQSEYVMYSIADGWITDNRFGSFSDLIARCNTRVLKGDMILTTQHLIAEHDWQRHESYVNVRGRGDLNRTHDVHADDCTIYPVNLVEFDDPVPMIHYKIQSSYGFDKGEWYEYKEVDHGQKLSENSVVIERYERIDRHVFISQIKKYSYCDARANFEIYDNEYINLTYMNSVWLEYVVTNKTLGDWHIKGVAVNYAYAIRYLNTALDHVRKREKTERALLEAEAPGVCDTPEWQVALSEWKLANQVREITPYQAKRFVKHIMEAL